VTIVNRRRTTRLAELGEDLVREYSARGTRDEDKEFYPIRVVLGVPGEDDFDLESTIAEADIIIAATPSTSPLFPSSTIPIPSKTDRKKAIILIGSYKPHMREISSELVQHALEDGGKIVVDSREACLQEAGELQGLGPEDVVELGELLGARSGEGTGSDIGAGIDRGQVRIFKSVSPLPSYPFLIPSSTRRPFPLPAYVVVEANVRLPFSYAPVLLCVTGRDRRTRRSHREHDDRSST
jgi:hypothetical protein